MPIVLPILLKFLVECLRDYLMREIQVEICAGGERFRADAEVQGLDVVGGGLAGAGVTQLGALVLRLARSPNAPWALGE